MVDEYQDTNYIQEQLLICLAGSKRNLCVVGDEDQSLYRFRGATVRNILEFPRHFKKCCTVTLSINYRSHPEIVKAYNKFMASWDWSNPENGVQFRYKKTIIPEPGRKTPKYTAVFSIWGKNTRDEASRFADLIAFLKKNKVIEDESQIALLFHSVRIEHSGSYLNALSQRDIPAFCPRARAYFESEEVRYMVGCFAVLLGYYGKGRGKIQGGIKDSGFLY
jgi:DNA helicase-2/ATP-dependent DNA helicase PcrA